MTVSEENNGGVHEASFPPIGCLDDVTDHLSLGQPSPRNLMYTVLHLQAAAEVLLKARPVQEHWSLVSNDPGTAKRERFEADDTAPAPAIEVTAAQVRALPGPETAAAFGDLESVGTKVRAITSHMATQVKHLADQLKDVQDRTVMCPVCEQWVDVIAECRDCLTFYVPAAPDYIGWCPDCTALRIDRF